MKNTQDSNKKNILYFSSKTMRELYESLQKWQNENGKRFLTLNIQKENNNFVCIALTNPTEVVICHGTGLSEAAVNGGRLQVFNTGY